MEILQQDKLQPSLVIPKSVRVISKITERLSPYLATRLIALLFSTPIKYKTPEREMYMKKSAQTKRLAIKDIDIEIELLSYGYSPKKVLFVHGWAGRSTQFFAFADKLLENGYMVISFDGPAHGNSTGKKTMMPEFIETIKEINNQYGPFEAAIGHSFGALSLLNASTTFLNLKALVSIGSGNKISAIMQRFTNSLTMSDKAGKRLQKFAEKKWKLKVDDYAGSLAAKKIEHPVMIIHDTLDGDVPVSCSYEIRQSLQQGKLYITNGLGHTKILRNKTVVDKAVDFIIQHS